MRQKIITMILLMLMILNMSVPSVQAADTTDTATVLSTSLKSVKITSIKNTSEGIRLTWSKSPGATRYSIYRTCYKQYANGFFRSYGTIATCYGESNLSYLDTSVGNGMECTYRIYPYSGNESGNYYNVKTIVRVTGVKIKSLKSSSKKSMTVKWKKNSEATGYQVYFSTSKNFSKNTRALICRKASTISKRIKGMKAGKTYYVKIRAFKTYDGKRYYSVWSNVKKVKIKK